MINFINTALEKSSMGDLNLTNPSPYDENTINNNAVPYEELDVDEKFLKINLIDKYYILSTYNHCAGLFRLDYQFVENKKTLTAINTYGQDLIE